MALTLTTQFNEKISSFLADLGVVHNVTDTGVVTVDRTSMVQTYPAGDEHASYERVLILLKELCHPAYVCWGGRTDDWLGVEVYLR